ncbi:hypothetical protein [Spirosoma flavum]|uniref:Uncharacterized protein n=1 Tax=Spirosoma flavum TaxID=2048557 RepID=A0ABW6AR70_9BACT
MKDLNAVLKEFQEKFIFKLKYPYKPLKHDNEVKFTEIPEAIFILDEFRDDIKPYANEESLADNYSTIQQLTSSNSALYELASYDFNEKKFAQLYESSDGEQSAEDIIEEAKSDVEALAEIIADIVGE